LFYAKEYDTYYRPEVITRNYKYDPALAIKMILERSQGLIDLKKSALSILDIGAGMGDSLTYLKNVVNPGANYYAIESSIHCIEHLKKQGIELLTNDVDDSWDMAHEEKFDFIIMRHVLEHFLDPATVLSKARKVLKPDGVLYIGVPNAKKPGWPLLGNFFRVVHVSYFSNVSLTSLLGQKGLKNIRIVEGDAYDKHEIFSFCKKTTPVQQQTDPAEWLVQKKIYDSLLRKELYYKLRLFVGKRIVSLFR
jgi:SAM-dependent methyltransferase